MSNLRVVGGCTFDGEPFVNLVFAESTANLTTAGAREIARFLFQAAAETEHEANLLRYLIDEAKIPKEKAAAYIVSMRQYRAKHMKSFTPAGDSMIKGPESLQ